MTTHDSMAVKSGSGNVGSSSCCVLCSRVMQIKSQIVCAAFEFVYITHVHARMHIENHLTTVFQVHLINYVVHSVRKPYSSLCMELLFLMPNQ